jgi:hypothetical protein
MLLLRSAFGEGDVLVGFDVPDGVGGAADPADFDAINLLVFPEAEVEA